MANEVVVRNGIYWLDRKWSLVERDILNDCVDFLMERGFEFLQVPTSITPDSYVKQGISEPDGTPILGQPIGAGEHRLSGSAEQGILERLSGAVINNPLRIVAQNSCFREEPRYYGLKSLREFQKVEQFMCVAENSQEDAMSELLENATDFLDELDVRQYRVVDVTELDPGYHTKKYDIQVYTKSYGWLETHSCSQFGTEQSSRYGITGECMYTLSNTGIASPRILVPLLEEAGVFNG